MNVDSNKETCVKTLPMARVVRQLGKATVLRSSLCAAALSATLANAGWTVSSKVGRPVSLKNGEQRFSPFKDFAAVADGSLGADALGDRLIDLGISTLPVHRSKP